MVSCQYCKDGFFNHFKVENEVDVTLRKCNSLNCNVYYHNHCFFSFEYCFLCSINHVFLSKRIISIIEPPTILKENCKNLEFSLQIDNKTLLQMNSDSASEIYLYSVLLNNNFKAIKSFAFPQEKISLKVNQYSINLKNTTGPINIKHYLSNGNNKILFQYTSLSNIYMITILQQTKLSNNFKIHLVNSNLINSSQFERVLNNIELDQDIIDNLKNDCFNQEYFYTKSKLNKSDKLIEQEELAYKCVYSFQLINIPSRGKNCLHLSCFDYKNYIEINQNNKKWECPICRKITFKQDLDYDYVLLYLIVKYKNELNSISNKIEESNNDTIVDIKFIYNFTIWLSIFTSINKIIICILI